MTIFIDVISSLLTVALLIGIMHLISKRMQDKMENKRYKGWLIAHIVFVIIFMSGLLGNFLLTLVSTTYVIGQEQIYSAHFLATYFALFLTVPGIFGTLITGIWLVVRSKWGLFKHHWIIVKIIGTTLGMIMGRTWVVIWLEKAMILSQSNPMQNPLYLHSRLMLLSGVSITLIAMLFLIIISYIKPWGQRIAD